MTIPDSAPPGEHLAAVVSCLAARGIPSRLRLVAGITTVLAVDQPGPGPDPTTVTLAPGIDGSGLFEGTCLFTPAPGAAPAAAAAMIVAVLAALLPPALTRSRAPDLGPGSGARKSGRMTAISLPAPGDAARLARFLPAYPSWSVFWDKEAGLWRAAEDDLSSPLQTQSPDAADVIAYITGHALPGSFLAPGRCPLPLSACRARRPGLRSVPRLPAPAATGLFGTNDSGRCPGHPFLPVSRKAAACPGLQL